MGSVGNSVCYCCVSKGGRVLYTYNNGADHEIENLAALCLEMTPPYHRWYFQTMGKKTFGFLIDDGYVYFVIVYESLGNSGVLRFLQKLRDEFRKLGKRSSAKSAQDQLLPVVCRLIASLEHVGKEWATENQGDIVMPSPCNNNAEGGSSTKAPLLGKPSRQEKRKMKDDHVIAMREIETEEQHRRSTDRGVKFDSESNEQGTYSASPLRKNLSSARIKPSSQNLHKKWCRQVRIILAVDAAVCLVLLIIWLVICHGIECIR